MRFANWLRRLFCAHQFEVIRRVAHYEVDSKGRKVGDIPLEQKLVQRCVRCGWVWRQRA